MKCRMVLAQHNHPLREGQQVAVLGPKLPIYPADFVVLTVGIIVAVLGVADSISSKQHRHTLRQKESGQKISFLPGTQCVDCWVLGRAFDATIPTTVIVGAVAVFFTTGFVVFL